MNFAQLAFVSKLDALQSEGGALRRLQADTAVELAALFPQF